MAPLKTFSPGPLGSFNQRHVSGHARGGPHLVVSTRDMFQGMPVAALTDALSRDCNIWASLSMSP